MEPARLRQGFGGAGREDLNLSPPPEASAEQADLLIYHLGQASEGVRLTSHLLEGARCGRFEFAPLISRKTQGDLRAPKQRKKPGG